MSESAYYAQCKAVKTPQKHTALSVEIKSLFVDLSYEKDPVIYTMPTIWAEMTLEVYQTQYKQADVGLTGYEWLLIEVEKTPTGTAKKVVKFDSYEGGYSKAAIALRDALLFCSINNL